MCFLGESLRSPERYSGLPYGAPVGRKGVGISDVGCRNANLGANFRDGGLRSEFTFRKVGPLVETICPKGKKRLAPRNAWGTRNPIAIPCVACRATGNDCGLRMSDCGCRILDCGFGNVDFRYSPLLYVCSLTKHLPSFGTPFTTAPDPAKQIAPAFWARHFGKNRE